MIRSAIMPATAPTRDVMSTNQQEQRHRDAQSQKDANPTESLTDLIDRMDRESFRRTLEHRDLKVTSTRLQRRS
jgi:hypothetical protein